MLWFNDECFVNESIVWLIVLRFKALPVLLCCPHVSLCEGWGVREGVGEAWGGRRKKWWDGLLGASFLGGKAKMVPLITYMMAKIMGRHLNGAPTWTPVGDDGKARARKCFEQTFFPDRRKLPSHLLRSHTFILVALHPSCPPPRPASLSHECTVGLPRLRLSAARCVEGLHTQFKWSCRNISCSYAYLFHVWEVT